MPVPQRFLGNRERRFTVVFREAITIAATFARPITPGTPANPMRGGLIGQRRF
jgi:hypothetical protein